MPTQQQIERFTLAFHRLAIARIGEQPGLRGEALRVLDRWEAQGASMSSKVYRDRWRELLAADIATLEKAVCVDAEPAATLRSVSPLGFVLDDAERMRVRREAMAA